MSIDWEAKAVSNQQHVLRPEQTNPLVNGLEVGVVAYVQADALVADVNRGLWLHRHAGSYGEKEAEFFAEDIEMCRVIRAEEGFIVDASEGKFTIGEDSKDVVYIDAECDFEGGDWFPVVGLIETEPERAALGEILFTHYGIMLGRSALAPEINPDDTAGPGDEAAPA